jgi:hypothetical protein
MKKTTLGLTLGLFLLIGILGMNAYAQITSSKYVPASTEERFNNADYVTSTSLNDTDYVLTKPTRIIGESVADRYAASCTQVRVWMFNNVIKPNSGDGDHISIGDYRLNGNAVNKQGQPICQLERYAEKTYLGKCLGEYGRKKVWENGEIIGYVWRHQCEKTISDWKLVDISKPEQSYKDFVAGLDKTMPPVKMFKTLDGDE